MRSVILMAAMVVGVCAVADGRAQGWVDRTTATGPAPRAYHSMCYDPVRGYVMLAGGWGSQDPPQNPMRTEVWTWDGVSWTQRASTPFNDTRALVWHESTNQLIAIGATYSQTYNSVASIWDGATWSAPTALPFPVSSPVAGFDPIRQETIVYSGGSPLEVAVWNGASWASRPVVVPASIGYPSLALDPSVNRLVLAGMAGNYTPRFFEWSGFGWNQRLPAQAPTWPGSLATDSLRQRVILFDGDYDNLQPNHTWTLRNGGLTRLTTPVEPTLRRWAAMAFDPVRGKCVLFGGVSGSNFYLGDTWEFDLGPVASFGTFGSGCSGSRGVPSLTALSNSVPRVGGTFQARVSNLPWSGPAFLALGLSNTSYATTPLPADLGFLGAPGCSLLTSIEDVQPLVNVLGTATWSFPVPPLAGLPFYTQVLPLDPSANLLGFSASNGGVGVIGL